MSEGNKPWGSTFGPVQAFTKDGVKQAPVKLGDANGQPVWNLTVKSSLTGNYVDIAIWGEYAHVAPGITEGTILFVDGPVDSREHNGKTYIKINAKRLAGIAAAVPTERAVVNQVAAPVAAPVAAAPAAAVPAEAPVAAPAAPFSF